MILWLVSNKLGKKWNKITVFQFKFLHFCSEWLIRKILRLCSRFPGQDLNVGNPDCQPGIRRQVESTWMLISQTDQEGNQLQRPNVCKPPPPKKKRERERSGGGCPSNQVSAAAMTSASEKNSERSIDFSLKGTGGSPTERDPENRLGDPDIGNPGSPVSSGLQVPGEPGNFREKTKPPWWTSRGHFPSKCPLGAPAERVILSVDSLALWKIISEEDDVLIPKNSGREICQRIFALGILWGGVSRYAATPLIVA